MRLGNKYYYARMFPIFCVLIFINIPVIFILDKIICTLFLVGLLVLFFILIQIVWFEKDTIYYRNNAFNLIKIEFDSISVSENEAEFDLFDKDSNIVATINLDYGFEGDSLIIKVRNKRYVVSNNSDLIYNRMINLCLPSSA